MSKQPLTSSNPNLCTQTLVKPTELFILTSSGDPKVFKDPKHVNDAVMMTNVLAKSIFTHPDSFWSPDEYDKLSE